MKIEIVDNGHTLYETEFTYNCCIMRGKLCEIKRFDRVNRSSLMMSQGKIKETGEWRPSAFADLVDFGGFLDNMEKGETVHLVLKFAQSEYEKNGEKHKNKEFIVQGVVGGEQPEPHDL